MNAELLFFKHITVSLYLYKEYLTAVKIKTQFLLLCITLL